MYRASSPSESPPTHWVSANIHLYHLHSENQQTRQLVEAAFRQGKVDGVTICFHCYRNFSAWIWLQLIQGGYCCECHSLCLIGMACISYYSGETTAPCFQWIPTMLCSIILMCHLKYIPIKIGGICNMTQSREPPKKKIRLSFTASYRPNIKTL